MQNLASGHMEHVEEENSIGTSKEFYYSTFKVF